MSIPSADSFIRLLRDMVYGSISQAMEVYLGVVTAVATAGASVEVKRLGVVGTGADSGEGMVAAARVVGPALAVNDTVMVLRVQAQHFVIGEVGGDFAPTAEGESGIYTKMDDDAPTTSSNASTSTFTALYSDAIALPAGQWSGDHVVLAVFKNSVAANGATIRTSSPTASGGTTVTDPTANAPFVSFDRGGVSAVSGNVTFGAEYRASGGGTVTPQRWLRIIALRRVG